MGVVKKMFRRNPGSVDVPKRFCTGRYFFNFVWLILSLIFCCLLPVAQAQNNAPNNAAIQSISAGPEVRLEVLGERFAPFPALAPSQSRIVFYRQEDTRAGAISIFVNNRYHISLVPGSWSQLCFGSGAVQLALRQVLSVSGPSKDRFDNVSSHVLEGGQVQFFRVNMTSDQPVLGPVPDIQAQQELSSSREQLHTVSRAAQACLEVTADVVSRPAAIR